MNQPTIPLNEVRLTHQSGFLSCAPLFRGIFLFDKKGSGNRKKNKNILLIISYDAK